MDSWRNRKTLILSRTDMIGLLKPDEFDLTPHEIDALLSGASLRR